MNKSELVEALATGADLTKAQAGKVVESFVGTITDVLQKGEQLVIPGFGTFSVSHRAERTGRNPKTGEEILIKAARVAKFKAGKVLKEAVQEG